MATKLNIPRKKSAKEETEVIEQTEQIEDNDEVIEIYEKWIFDHEMSPNELKLVILLKKMGATKDKGVQVSAPSMGEKVGIHEATAYTLMKKLEVRKLVKKTTTPLGPIYKLL